MSSSSDEITDAAGGAGRDASAHDASTHDASDAAGVAARDATTDVPHAAPATASASAPGGAPAPALPTIASDTSLNRRQQRLRDLNRRAGAREFGKRRDGMLFAMDGGLWLHRHVWQGRPMVHLVSTNLERLLEYGEALGIPEARLQFKPLKDPRTNVRRDAWHWDLGGPVLPPLDAEIKAP